MLKATCDRLSAGTTKKETEIENLAEKIQQMDAQVHALTHSCMHVLHVHRYTQYIRMRAVEMFRPGDGKYDNRSQ